MNVWFRSARALAAGAILLVALAAGCSKSVPIYRIPEWYTEEIKAVAVVPFDSRQGGLEPGDQERFAEDLARTIEAPGKFRFYVYTPRELRRILSKEDYRLASSGEPDRIARGLRTVPDCQAFILGRVDTFDVSTTRQRREEPIYKENKKGEKVLSHYVTWMYTKHVAEVQVTGSAYELPRGDRLYTGTPVGGQVAVESSPPPSYAPPQAGPDELLAYARKQAMAQLSQEFSIQWTEISVDPKKTIFVATGKEAGQWVQPERITTADERMQLVVDLPPQADRNQFRVEIVSADAEGDSKPVLETIEVNWNRSDSTAGGRGFGFSPAEIARKGTGAGKYTLRFYSSLSEQPAFTRDIKIEQPEG